MPDTTFSWRGFRAHLRRFLWLYALVIAASLVITQLIWLMTSPRLGNEEQVVVYLADAWSDPEPLEALSGRLLERAGDETLKAVRFEGLMYSDDLYTSNMLLMTRLSVGEGDVFLASQSAMDALVNAGALLPLDEALAGGWMSGLDLPPYEVTTADEATGEETAWTAGLRLDGVDALRDMGAFNNRGAYLCVAVNGGNTETTLKVAEDFMRTLQEAGHAATEAP